MNAKMLYLEDGRAAEIWFCSECKIVHRTEGEAQKCCAPRMCACGTALEKYSTQCTACWSAEQAKREQARVDAAPRVTYPEYNDPVFYNDEFHSSVDDFMDSFANGYEFDEDATLDDEFEFPWIWSTVKVKMHMDADDIIYHALEDSFEDAADRIDDDAKKMLQMTLDAWCSVYGVPWWEEARALVVGWDDEARVRLREELQRILDDKAREQQRQEALDALVQSYTPAEYRAYAEKEAQTMLSVSLAEALAMLDRGELDGTLAETRLKLIRSMLVDEAATVVDQPIEAPGEETPATG